MTATNHATPVCCPTCSRADPTQETEELWRRRSSYENMRIAYKAIVDGDRFFGNALLAFERDRHRCGQQPEPLRVI